MSKATGKDEVVRTTEHDDGSVTKVHESGNTTTTHPDGSKTGTLHFWTTGKAMTHLAREIWIGGDYHRAIRFCLESFGMTEGQAIELLTGQKKLEGDTRFDKNGLEWIDDNQNELYGIPLSLTYALLQTEQLFNMNNNAMNMVTRPWLYLDYESPHKVDPGKNMRPGNTYGHAWDWMSKRPLGGYNEFVWWIDYTTKDGELETKWYQNPITPDDKWKEIREKETPLTTQQFLMTIDSTIGHIVVQQERWRKFYGIRGETGYGPQMERDFQLGYTKPLPKAIQKPEPTDFSEENLSSKDEKELIDLAKREIKRLKEMTVEEQRKIDETNAKIEKLRAEQEEEEQLRAPYKDWNPERVKKAYKNLTPGLEMLVAQSMSQNIQMNAISEHHVENIRMIESILVRQGILHRQPDTTPDPELVEPSGWIAPNGDYYHCGYMGHIPLAQAITEDVIGLEEKNGEATLENRGWMKISEMRLLHGTDRRPMPEQIDTLERLIEKYGEIKYLHKPYKTIQDLIEEFHEFE